MPPRGARHVAHMHEVLGLRAITNDPRPPATTYPVERLDDVERIGCPIVLALAIDGGMAQHNVFETAVAVSVAAARLADDLAGAVQGGSGRRSAEWKGVPSTSLPAM